MKSKRSLRLMYLIALFQGMVFYGPVATLYRQAQGVSLFQITLIESISLALAIALEIPWGAVADRIGYKNTLLVCNVLYFLSKIVFWRATGFGWFLAERLILSVVLSGLSGCDSAYLYLAAGKDGSTRAFGRYSAFGTCGLVLASLTFSAFLAKRSDYSLTGLLTVISYGVSMAATLFLKDLREAPAPHTALKDRLRAVSRAVTSDKSFVLFLLGAALLAETNQTVTVFFSQVQYVRAGISQQAMGLIYILVTLCGLLAAFAHRLQKRLGERAACWLLFLTGSGACLLTALTANPLLSVLGIVLLRVSASVFAPISLDIQNRRVPAGARATVLSVYSSVMSLTAVFTNLLFGRLANQSLPLALGAGAALCAAGLGLYALWARRVRPVTE
ncbi:MAG: MFS transporter [Eubacteriales bacterium]|nr:MFS transporter [Eubacteriales bacterium]